jgi:hypothetical protein
MSTKRAHILLPDDLLQEIDSLVGPRGRSAFLVQTARTEVRRQKLLQFLEGKGASGKKPTWREADHPELSGGTEVWVRKIRQESDSRAPHPRPKKPARKS